MLLSLKTKDRLDLESSPAGKAAIEALAAGMRETDLLGWVKWPTVVGVIFPEIGAAEPALAVGTSLF
jgi:hypothetical protein